MSRFILLRYLLLLPGFMLFLHFAQAQKSLPKQIWDEQESYINGYARVLLHNNFSFINEQDQLIHTVEFDAARNFSNHFAAVKKGNYWGFINENGITTIPISYEIVFDFTETVTAAYSDKKWLLINTKGELVKTLDITAFYGFEKGVAKIHKEGRWGVMNTKGDIVFNKVSGNNILSKPIPYNPGTSPLSPTITVCPDNIDFEYGSFQNWKCFIGRVDSVDTVNVITVNPSPPTANRHTLYSKANPSAIDAFGLFPTNPPDGSNFAVRLGNTNIGAQAERIRYSIQVPANDSNFSLKYDYAVVFEDPGHTIWTQPRFTVKVFDSAANVYVECASFEYISTSSLPGFAHSVVDTNVMYKPWSTVFLSLRGYAGKTMFLEFTTADCVRRGHWGYAYVDVERPCGQSVQMQYDCTPPNITTLTGPPGFQTYNWWSQNFDTLLGSGQQIILNPGPAVNTVIWLEMIPFNNFGCLDTIPVTITGEFTADFTTSDTNGVCAPHAFTFYNTHLPSSSAIWDFGDGTTGSGDTVTHTYMLPGTYIVRLHVVLPGGCIGNALKTVSVSQPVGSFSFNQTYYCNNQTVRFDAIINSTDSLIWNFGDGTILRTLQTTVFHTYTAPGIYLPFLTLKSNGGCENTVLAPDTVKIEMLNAGFLNTEQKICGSTLLNFTDTSYSYFGITSWQWNFGDGSTATGSNVSHTYTTTGTYNVRLIITGISGCLDTIIKPIYVKVDNFPVASITGVTALCQSQSATFSSNIVSADAVNAYSWTSSNGYNGSGTTFTVPFPQAGNFTIQLVAGTVFGCLDTALHQITINPTPDVNQPPGQAVCNNDFTTPVIFSGSVTGTSYAWTNSAPSIGLAANGTGNIASFQAFSNGAYTANATITVTPSANGCTGPPELFVITVSPTPDVVQPSNQLVCNNSSSSAIIFSSNVTGTSYSWVNNNPSIGLPASGTGNINSFIAVNNTLTTITATITVTPIANGCTGPSKTFTITVKPTPDVIQPASQMVCNNGNTTAIVFASNVTGTTFSWVNDHPSIGLAASGNGNINSFTAVNNTLSNVTATITVTPTANGCTGPSKTFTIIVHPTPDVLQPSDQTVCNNGNTATIVFTGNVTGTTYNWTNNNPSIGLATAGTGNINSFVAVNNSSTTIAAIITVTPTANGCTGPSKTFTINIDPTPNVIQPSNQTVCNNGNTNAMVFTSIVNGTAFNWTNNNPSIGLAANGTGNINSFVAINNSTVTAIAVITVTPIANGCSGPTKTFTITVHPTPDIIQPLDQTVCNNTSTSAIVFAGNVSGTTYNWTNSNPSIGLAASGTGNINPFIAINSSTAAITSTITVTPFANGCPGPSKTFIITVHPSPDIIPIANQAVCNNNSTTAINFTSNVTGTTFSWTNNNTSIGLAASGNGTINAFIAINNSTVAATASTALITVTPFAAACTGLPKTFNIIVHPTPVIDAGNDKKLCLGSSVQLAATGAAQYSWSPATQLSCVNCNSPIANPSDTTIYRVSGTSLFGCSGNDSVMVNVIKPFQMPVSPNDTLCIGESLILKATNAATYLWSPATGLNRTNIAEPIARPNITTHYRVIGYDGHNCFKDTGYVLITVGPKPYVHIGPDRTLATGTVLTLNALTQNGPIISWLWNPATDLSCNNCPAPTTTVKNNSFYGVTVTNIFGCIATDTIFINSFCKNSQVYIPNAFTPDGDGLNDVLMVRGKGITVKSFRIFSRWGELVFEKENFIPNDLKTGWDGKIRGIPATPDVYVYTAEVFCDNGMVYIYKGNATLLK